MKLLDRYEFTATERRNLTALPDEKWCARLAESFRRGAVKSTNEFIRDYYLHEAAAIDDGSELRCAMN